MMILKHVYLFVKKKYTIHVRPSLLKINNNLQQGLKLTLPSQIICSYSVQFSGLQRNTPLPGIYSLKTWSNIAFY